MVLKTTEPFNYESPERGKSTMFHATVVTPTQFFQVKVLNSDLKEKFTKRKVIIISCYFECKGILEINEASSVSEAGADEPVEVPNRIVKRANETPKIDNLYKQASGTLVYGLFMLHKVIAYHCFPFSPSTVEIKHLHLPTFCLMMGYWRPVISPLLTKDRWSSPPHNRKRD